MYKAGPGSPSLERLRRPGHRVPLFKQLAVVPLGDDGGHGHYLLAGSIGLDELHIYSSADQTWSIRPLPSGACPVHILADKVIPLGDGGGVVGWVDLRVGVAVCDLLREPLEVRFIPLPQPLPANRERWERYREFRPGDLAWRFRDVAVSNGVLKFVEVEHRWIVTTIGPAPEEEPTTDPREKDVLLDSDLIRLQSRKRKAEDAEPKQVRRLDGWRMVTWSRPAMSSDCWHKGCDIDVDDVAVDDTITSSLRSGVGRDEHDESFRFRNMCSGFPTLSTDADDLVYLKTVERANDSKAWMVALDLGKKTMTALGGYSFDRHDPCAYNFRLCSFPNYLNMDPADSSQTTKLKDSADPLKTRQSSAEEASCPYKDKPRDAVRRLMLGLKTEDQDHRSIRDHGAENGERGNDSSGLSLPPTKRPVIKQSDEAVDHPNPPDVMSPVNNVVARPRPTVSSSLLPQVPVPPQQYFGQWTGAGNHPNAHHAVNHPNAHAFFNHYPNAHAFNNHHLHDATGLRGSCPPPPWNGVSYQQNHPWPPPHQQYVAQAQQWNVNLQQNRWGVGYGHYGAPNLPARGMRPAGQFLNQPAWTPQAELPIRQGPTASKKGATDVSNQLQ